MIKIHKVCAVRTASHLNAALLHSQAKEKIPMSNDATQDNHSATVEISNAVTAEDLTAAFDDGFRQGVASGRTDTIKEMIDILQGLLAVQDVRARVPFEDLDLSSGAYFSLRRDNVRTVGDFLALTEERLTSILDIRPAIIEEIAEKRAELKHPLRRHQ